MPARAVVIGVLPQPTPFRDAIMAKKQHNRFESLPYIAHPDR
jgi:hypothetical protein